MRIKKGDIVGRKSYGKDILFMVEKIIKINDNSSFAILKGLTIRIEADSPINDLEIVEKEEIIRNLKMLDNQIECRCKRKGEQTKVRSRQEIKTGRILHLDGDRRYTEKSIKYYKDMGLNAIVKNVAEMRQPMIIKGLLERYKPDILVVTGHDSMIKSGRNYNDIYNYRNSRYFINTVKEARKIVESSDELIIFAGACQSYFEGIMMAGANFASSPERILIDFIDPLIVAEKVATTEKYRYISINEIAVELKDGLRGIGGTKAKGKKELVVV